MPHYLEITDESGELSRIELTSATVGIGRSSSSDIQLDHPTVSRKHAQLTCVDGTWTLTDLNSTTGTCVNGQRIERHEIDNDSAIKISRFNLRLIDAQSALSSGTSTSAHWATETAPPQISALTFGPSPKIDLSHITSLNEFGRALLDDDDPVSRLSRLCAVAAGGVLGGHWAILVEVDNDSATVLPRIISSAPVNLTEHEDVHISRTAIGAAQENHSPILADNFSQDIQSVEMSVVPGSAAAAVAVCPLSNENGVSRMLYVNMPPQFASTEWLAVISLAVKEYQQAEAVLREREDAKRRATVANDMKNARTIQRSILPDPLAVAGLDIAWSFVPCDAVGGDFVDVVTLPDGQILLAIADVSGHGLAAALATLTIHSVLQTCIKSGENAQHTMTMLNEHLCAYLPESRFVTMAVVLIDPKTGKTECINAGHHAPIIASPSGAIRELNNGGNLILGVQHGEMTSKSDCLEPGDTMLLYTDGLIEMRQPSGAMLMSDGLAGLFANMHASTRTAAEVSDSLRVALDQIQGDQPVLDDQTFMIAHRH